MAAAGDAAALFADQALRKHMASADLAETRCGREPDGHLVALTCARFANDLLRETEMGAEG